MSDTEIDTTIDDDMPGREIEYDDAAAALMVRTLLSEAARVDFQGAPPLDKKGNPRFTELDERLRFEPANDIGNAERLLQRFGNKLLYVKNYGWFGWTGTHWSQDRGDVLAQMAAQDTAKLMKRELLALIAAGPRDLELEKDFRKRVGSQRSFINGCGNASRLNAMLTTAQPKVTKAHDDLDRHPFKVTVDNGTLDLNAGRDDNGAIVIALNKHDPADLIARKMAVKYDPKATAPRFEQFVREILPDESMQTFLQVFLGYCLTGDTSDQVVVMLFGQGANGKSVLMWLMTEMFGEYSKGIPIESLMEQQSKSGSAATPELARLAGIRYVPASEPPAGARFGDNFMKKVSGEEKIAVRNLHEGFVDLLPQFKLCISFNTKPRVAAADFGFWRRVALVPFDQKFVKAEEMADNPGAHLRDPQLKKKLREESSGILNWMIDGYRIWRERGMVIPEAIQAAVAEYKAETNHVVQFLADWCVFEPIGTVTATQLYEAYELWCTQNSLDPFSKRFFGTKVREDGRVSVGRGAATNIYKGMWLNDEASKAVANKPSRGRRHTEDDKGEDAPAE